MLAALGKMRMAPSKQITTPPQMPVNRLTTAARVAVCENAIVTATEAAITAMA